MIFLESRNEETSEEEIPQREKSMGILLLEYDNDRLSRQLKSPDKKMIFDEGVKAIDIHIPHTGLENDDEKGKGFASRLDESLRKLADYILANKETVFRDVQMVRGVTYDVMAKIAKRAGFNAKEIWERSLPGNTDFKITGEYLHTKRAKRGKKIDAFFAIYMGMDEFLEKYGAKQETCQ